MFDEHSDKWKKNFELKEGKIVLKDKNKVLNTEVFSHITNESQPELALIANFINIIEDDELFNELNSKERTKVRQGMQFVIFNYLNENDDVFEKVDVKDKGFKNYEKLGIKRKLKSEIIESFNDGKVHDIIKNASVANFIKLLDTNFETLLKDYSNDTDFDDYFSYGYKDILINKGFLPESNEVMPYVEKDNEIIDRFLSSNDSGTIQSHIDTLQKVHANLNKVNEYLLGNTKNNPYVDFKMYLINDLPLQVKGFNTTYTLGQEIAKNGVITQQNINDTLRALNILYNFQLKQFKSKLGDVVTTTPQLEIGLYNENTVTFYNKDENDKALLKLFLFEYTLNSRVTLNDAYHMLYGNGINMAVFDGDNLLLEETLYNFYKRNTAARSPNIPHSPLLRSKNTLINGYIDDLKGPSYELRKNIILNEPIDSAFANDYIHLLVPSIKDFTKFVETKYAGLSEDDKKKIYIKYNGLIKDQTVNKKVVFTSNFYINNGKLTAQIQDILEDYLKSHKDFKNAIKTLTVTSSYAFIKHTDAHDVMSFQFFIERALSYGYISNDLGLRILQDINNRKQEVKENIALKRKDNVELTIDDFAPLLYNVNTEYVNSLKDELYEIVKNSDMKVEFKNKTKSEIELETLMVLLMKDVFVGFNYNDNLRINELIFDKNSTRVLLPQHTYTNTTSFDDLPKLELLRLMMDINDIDRISPPSAIKTNVSSINLPSVGFWNVDYQNVTEVYDWFSGDNVPKLELNYNNYGDQTPQSDSDKSIWASQGKALILMNQAGKIYRTIVKNGNIIDNAIEITSENLSTEYQRKWKELYKSEYLKLLRKIEGENGSIDNDKLIKHIVQSLSHSANMSKNDKDSFMTVLNYMDMVLQKEPDHESANSLLYYINEKLKINDDTNKTYKTLFDFFGKNEITTSDLNKFVIPLVFNPNSNKLQSVLNSLVTTKLTSKGFKAVLIPDIAHIGSKNIPTRENLIIASDEWNPSMPLKDKRIENGKVKPTQIVVSWNYRGYNQYMFDVDGNKVYLSKDEMDELTRPSKSFDLDAVEGLNERLAEIKHKYKNVKLFVKGDQIFINATSKNKEVLDIKQFLTDGKLDFKKFDKRLLLGIGNRIPAQIISSLTDFEIVGFITGIERATVIAPSDIIVRMGSDFDIDTLYSLLYNFKYSFFNSKKLNLIEYTDESDPNAEKIRYTKYLEQRLKNIGNVDDIKSLRNTVANAIHISPKNYKYSLLKVIYYKMIFASLSFIKTVAELKSPIEVNDENSIYKVMYKLLHNKFFIYDKVNKVYKLNDDIIKDNLPKNLLNVINKSKKDTWNSDEYLKMMDDIYTLVYPLYKEKPAGLHLANEIIKIDEENVSFIDYVADKLLKGESIRLKEFNNIYFKIKSVFNNYKEENEGKIFYDFIKVLDNNFQKSFAKFDKTNSYLYTSITEKDEKGDDESTEEEINQDNIDIRFELLKEMADKLIKKGVDTIDSFEIFRLKSVLAQNSFLAIENAIKDDFMTVLRHPDNVSLMMKPLKYGSFYNEHTSLTVKEKNKMVDDLKSIEFNSEKWFNKFSDYVDKYSLAIVIDAFSDRVLMRDPLNFLFNIKMYDSTRVDLTIIGAMALNQVGTVLLQTNEDRVKYYNIAYDVTKSILGTNDMLIFGIKDKLLTMGLSDAGLVKDDGVINNQTLDKLTLGSNIISLGVDSSKIQVLSRLNATSINLNAYMGFMSKGMNEHWIALITNQDSIKDLNKKYDYYISERETRTIAYNSALGDIFMRYLNQLPAEFIENDEDLSKLIDNNDILQALVYVSNKITKEENNYVYNIKSLFETFYNKESDTTNYLYTQILSLYNFTVAYELGNALGDFFRKTNVDSQGIGSTYHGVILTLDKLEDVFKEHAILNIGNLYGDSMYLKYNYRLNTSYIETIEDEDYLVFERLHEIIQYLLDYDVHKTAFDDQELKGVKFKFNNLIISEKNEREEDIVNFIKSIIQKINSDDSKLSVYELLFIMKHEILKNKFNSRDDIVTEDYSVSRKKDVVSIINSFMMDISRENVFEHNIPYTMAIINEVIKKQTYTQVSERLMAERLKKIASYLLIPNDTLRLDNVIILPTHYKYFAIKYGSETAKNLYKDYFPYKSKLYSSLKHKLLEVNGFSPIYWTNNRYKLLDMHLSSYVAAKFYNVTKEQRQEYIEDTLSKYTALINNPNLNNSYKEFLNSFAKQEFNGLRYLIFLNSDSKNTNVDVYKVFESMFVDNDPDVSDFANSLLRYWLVVNGAYTSYRSIGSAIPNSIYLQQAISLYFRKIDWNDVETNTIFDKDDYGFLIQVNSTLSCRFCS
jgi:hypothetical protein